MKLNLCTLEIMNIICNNPVYFFSRFYITYMLQIANFLKYGILCRFERHEDDSSVCRPVCSQGCENAICSAPEQCTCLPGYVRSPDPTKCKSPCDPKCVHGTCVDGTCTCVDGWVGADCAVSLFDAIAKVEIA